MLFGNGNSLLNMRKKKKKKKTPSEGNSRSASAQVRLARMQAQVPMGPLLGSGWYFPAYCSCTINLTDSAGRMPCLLHIPTAADPASH